MAIQDSLGLVEVLGLAAAIEVSDAMVKTAWVKVKTVANADAGLLTVICEGDLAACKASVDAGAALATAKGALVGTNLIARPAEGLDSLIDEYVDTVTDKPAPKAKAEAAKAKPKAKGGK